MGHGESKLRVCTINSLLSEVAVITVRVQQLCRSSSPKCGPFGEALATKCHSSGGSSRHIDLRRPRLIVLLQALWYGQMRAMLLLLRPPRWRRLRVRR